MVIQMTKIKKKPKKIMRMNNNSRFTMRNIAVGIKFDKQESKLNTRIKALAYEIHQAYYTPEILNLMLALPIGAFKWSNTITILGLKSAAELGYGMSYHYNNTPRNTFKLSWYLPEYYDNPIPLDSLPTKLQRKIKRLHLTIIKFQSEKSTYSNKVYTFIKSCKSCKQMLELLPESYNWLPDVEGCSDTDIADKAAAIVNL